MANVKTARDYQVDIGIETHVQFKTKSKLFCGCDNDARDAAPNTHICPICLGLPGTLPVLNKGAIQLAIRTGSALNARINRQTKFDRKNYFYPDLPKGYQITQYDQPIISDGYIDVPATGQGQKNASKQPATFRVRIERAHLEEDAGKTIHPSRADYSLVDFNRTGTPLLEIVSKPDIHSPAEARAYAQELYYILRYADVSHVDLYHGNLRFDVNLSVRKRGDTQLGTRSETKNLNSFRAVERASRYEMKRQMELLDKGRPVAQETRGWDDAKGKTVAQRTKEEAFDYRYFPEPDLPPLRLEPSMIDEVQERMPELPQAIRDKLAAAGLSAQDSNTLLSQPNLLQLAVSLLQSRHLARIANWLTTEVQRAVSQAEFDWDSFQLTAENLEKLAAMVEDNELSSTAAKQVLEVLITQDTDPRAVAEKRQLLQVSDEGAIDQYVEDVIQEHEQAVADYQAGQENSLQFLVGQVMKASRGQANPQLARTKLKEKLDQ